MLEGAPPIGPMAADCGTDPACLPDRGAGPSAFAHRAESPPTYSSYAAAWSRHGLLPAARPCPLGRNEGGSQRSGSAAKTSTRRRSPPCFTGGRRGSGISRWARRGRGGEGSWSISFAGRHASPSNATRRASSYSESLGEAPRASRGGLYWGSADVQTDPRTPARWSRLLGPPTAPRTPRHGQTLITSRLAGHAGSGALRASPADQAISRRRRSRELTNPSGPRVWHAVLAASANTQDSNMSSCSPFRVATVTTPANDRPVLRRE